MNTTTDTANNSNIKTNAFPHLKVLNLLIQGTSADKVARKFGLYDETSKSNPLKVFNAHVRRAQKTGFAYDGKVIKFPDFDATGKPIFGRGRRNKLFASMLAKEWSNKTMVVAKPVDEKLSNKTVVVAKPVDEKRAHKPFPYAEIIKEIKNGASYKEIAQEYGYYSKGQQDPTKPLRAALSRARTNGYIGENGERVYYTDPVGDANKLVAKVEHVEKAAKKVKATDDTDKLVAKVEHVEKVAKKVKATDDTKAETDEQNDNPVEIKFRTPATRGRKPNTDNAVVMALDSSGKFISISVPKAGSIVDVEELLNALLPLIDARRHEAVQQLEDKPVEQNIVPTGEFTEQAADSTVNSPSDEKVTIYEDKTKIVNQEECDLITEMMNA